MSRISLGVCVLVLSCCCLTSQVRAQSRVEYGYPPPQFEPPPPSGIGAMVVGYAGLGIAGLNLVTIPVCYADFYDSNLSRGCMIASVVVASVALSVGIPSLIAGRHRRERYKAWRARQRARGEPSPWLSSSGAGVQYALRF